MNSVVLIYIEASELAQAEALLYISMHSNWGGLPQEIAEIVIELEHFMHQVFDHMFLFTDDVINVVFDSVCPFFRETA